MLGMTDAELECVCKVRFNGYAPWAYWTSEIYSFGKCFRLWTKYPRILPLYVYSDHGVALSPNLEKNELENPAAVHFTWHPLKGQKNKENKRKEVVRIMHPWISYRRSRGIARAQRPRGTIVFYSHSTPGLKYEGHDTEEYFAKLKNLPEKFQPIVLCLHMHDVNAGQHKTLRRHGFPIVTAGNASSIYFVDHFYNLVKDYAYGTSQDCGSNVFYCVELGLPYFFLGEYPRIVNMSDKNFPIGPLDRYYDKDLEEFDKMALKLFDVPVDSVTSEQRAFVQSFLGCDSAITPKQVSRILWREFFRHWRRWPLIFKAFIVVILRKARCLEPLKKVLSKVYKPNARMDGSK